MHDEWDISASNLAIGDQEVFCFAGESEDPRQDDHTSDAAEPLPACNVIPFRARAAAWCRSTREAGR